MRIYVGAATAEWWLGFPDGSSGGILSAPSQQAEPETVEVCMGGCKYCGQFGATMMLPTLQPFTNYTASTVSAGMFDMSLSELSVKQLRSAFSTLSIAQSRPQQAGNGSDQLRSVCRESTSVHCTSFKRLPSQWKNKGQDSGNVTQSLARHLEVQGNPEGGLGLAADVKATQSDTVKVYPITKYRSTVGLQQRNNTNNSEAYFLTPAERKGTL
ncbi:hypothetical protein PO909_033498 [Leuciscus waleckii]